MTGFERPALLALALPWVAFCLWLGWAQWTAVVIARRRIAARFLALVTRYTGPRLALHLTGLAAIGLMLLVVAAEPIDRDRLPPAAAGGRLLLLFDASASMYATDIPPFAADLAVAGEQESTRFEAARAIARRIAAAPGLESTRFAVAGFSGTTTLNLPMTADRNLLGDVLTMIEGHNYYQNTGSSLARALELAFHFTEDGTNDLQVIVLGDGELPFEESFSEPLASLADLGVAVHTVAIGSAQGQARVIYDFHDVVAKREPRRKLAEYTTRRVDAHYREIASRTGGFFVTAEPAAVDGLIAEVERRAGAVATEPSATRRDRFSWIFAGALLGFLFHLWFLTRGRRRDVPGFDLGRVGTPRATGAARGAAWIFLLLAPVAWGCGSSVRRQAHRANESGIALDDLGRDEAARRQFERAASLAYRSEIPIHNLARMLARRGSYTEAHRLFQRALELEPGLADAVFNDGVTLFEWGVAERDPRDCQLARTLELWQSARHRFASLLEGVVEREESATRAAENLEALDDRIAEVEKLIAEPPPECAGASGGGGGEGEQDENAGAGGAGAGDPEDGEDGGSPPPASPPPGADGGSGSGPLTQDELGRIERELARITEQRTAEGKYYRRTRPEQFSRQDWSQPDAVIWW